MYPELKLSDKARAYVPKRPLVDANKRMRVGTAVVYEDSVSPDYMAYLRDLHMQVLLSPWHDKDENPDGTLKKKHRHIVLMYETVNPKWKFAEVFDAIGAVYSDREMEVASIRGMARYLCHLDNPEKYTYDTADVVELGGADYASLIERKADDKRVLREMMQYAREHKVNDWATFVERCMDKNLDWYDFICTGKNVAAVRYYVIGRGQRERDNYSRALERRAAGLEDEYMPEIGDRTFYGGVTLDAPQWVDPETGEKYTAVEFTQLIDHNDMDVIHRLVALEDDDA